ncbi:TerC family protein [Sporolactobacillus sp. Y61]|jgi:YjbE family integral membrane protein|uniref:TerC family protein n=1 Tax=Sporolactobacillus sp. Y61 TaxID=3160863 RepID=A0AAU8IEV8_9BACL|nr:TerC family protein [Sporolactobacillus sp. THM19-2]RYL94518.1 TerC family protein [Sporolactobacillus sp. THM19-2]
MDIFSVAFWSSFLAIIGIDLFLAGDNAVVIAMAARRLPDDQRKRAILYGTIGAVIIRILCTVTVVYLLMIPGLHFIGGILLVWIAYRLLKPEDHNQAKAVKAADSIWGAVRTIILADALMSLDNMLAVAGASGNHPLLVVIGLLVSVPLLMGGSAIIMKLIDRYHWLIYLGAAILGVTAGRMLFSEPFVKEALGSATQWVEWPVVAVITVVILVAGRATQKKAARKRAQQHHAV